METGNLELSSPGTLIQQLLRYPQDSPVLIEVCQLTRNHEQGGFQCLDRRVSEFHQLRIELLQQRFNLSMLTDDDANRTLLPWPCRKRAELQADHHTVQPCLNPFSFPIRRHRHTPTPFRAQYTPARGSDIAQCHDARLR